MSRQLFEEARKVLTQEAAVKLDPVGQEDKDIDNDRDVDTTDKYLHKRRKAISAAIASSKNESSLSDEDIAKLKDILGEQGVAEGSMSDLDADRKDRQYQSRQAKTTMKHIPNPTAGEKAAAKDIKPGIAGYRDRIDMLKSAEARGGLKKEEAEQVDEAGVKEEDETVSEGRPYSAMQRIGRYGSTRGSSYLDLGGRREAPPAPKPTTTALKPTEDKKKKEEVEQTDEGLQAKLTPQGKAAVAGVSKKIGAKKLSQTKDLVALAKMNPKNVKEDTEQEDFELIENLNFALPEHPSYQDFIKAALTIAECNSFSELSEEDQRYIISEMEDAFRNNDLAFIAEAEALSDMNDTVQRLRKAGHRIEDMGKDYKGQPYYVYVDKGTGLRRKVTYKGNQKVTQNMGKAAPEDTNEA